MLSITTHIGADILAPPTPPFNEAICVCILYPSNLAYCLRWLAGGNYRNTLYLTIDLHICIYRYKLAMCTSFVPVPTSSTWYTVAV